MFALVVAAAVDAPQCSSVPLKEMIANYAELIHKQDSAAIAHLFGTDGEIDNPGAKPIRGETAVKALLSGFKGAVVTSETMTVDKIDGAGKAWHVTGRFHQTGRTPEAKDYDVSGSFDSNWTCGPDGWRIERMATGK
jgi:ketosteroid isomerase-like protein